MGRRKGLKLDGWFIIDKPKDMTSTKVVSTIKRLTGAAKVGHAGTLDPLATGVLPVGMGEATKAMPYIVDTRKTYEFTVAFGLETETDDLEGAPTLTGGKIPHEEDIRSCLQKFTGRIEQVPPIYSAIKVDGKRAYDLARQGAEVTLKSRQVEIYDLTLVFYDSKSGEARFSVTCGKGTYVRSLGRDIARALGTYGHITALRRTKVGPFDAARAISLEKLEKLSHSAPAVDYALPVMTALDDIPALAVTKDQAQKIRHGLALDHPSVEESLKRVTYLDQLVAIAQAKDGKLRPLRVFNL